MTLAHIDMVLCVLKERALHVIEGYVGTFVVSLDLAYSKELLVWRKTHGGYLLEVLMLANELHLV